ncbi:helix-turn-helix domain-containing protein [Leptolyngbya sp. FACHB-36]|uniref:helix-turn-helix domain-containing protein n=1 Tax=Leptolyngbya sp. FACHB-36 TaxID=2692808 RepID=UPI001680B8ED|nr:helix-turn-helix domain-containing protein [Leptolyngbya sp. FACHB-36]MBD2020868.1 helix-turn-helix domain-containing protein [Leptolyngbya sp. FACHB-36]
MTPRKLSESDKQQILELYRQPRETTSTLAERYGVSNSTISRILKTGLAEADYEALIQQKRVGRSPAEPVATATEVDAEPVPVEVTPAAEVMTEEMAPEEVEAALPLPQPVEATPAAEVEAEEVLPEPVPLEPVMSQLDLPEIISRTPAGPERRSRRRSSAETVEPQPEPQQEVLELIDLAPVSSLLSTAVEEPNNGSSTPEAAAVEEMLGEELGDQEALLDLDEGDDLDDDDLDDDDLDDGLDDETDLSSGGLLVGSRVDGLAVEVLPLSNAPIPKTCYLVIDRASELIARPLSDFGDLGQIPAAEVQEKTLPVFDNHRIAKRFSNPRTQRVIKLPDGRVLQKTTSHLQAKGITRLLIDGQVYSI